MERKLSQDFYSFLFFFAMLRPSNLAFDEKRKNESAPNELWKKMSFVYDKSMLCFSKPT